MGGVPGCLVGGEVAPPLGDRGADPEEPAMHVLIMSWGPAATSSPTLPSPVRLPARGTTSPSLSPRGSRIWCRMTVPGPSCIGPLAPK